MKPLSSLRTAPIAAALFVLLAAAGCKNHDNAANTDTGAMPPAAATAATPMPAESASAMGNGMESTMPPASSTSASAMSSAMPAEGAPPMGAVAASDFYSEAMKGDQKEINSSQMVEKSGSSADVKKLAKKIDSDHTAFDKKVKAAAGSNATMPSAADTTDSSLAGKTGADLDKAYVDAMVTDHQTDIPKFENAAKNASTPEARKLASDVLPTLREHLKMAQDLQAKMGAK